MADGPFYLLQEHPVHALWVLLARRPLDPLLSHQASLAVQHEQLPQPLEMVIGVYKESRGSASENEAHNVNSQIALCSFVVIEFDGEM
jgi:hypothetical protein